MSKHKKNRSKRKLKKDLLDQLRMIHAPKVMTTPPRPTQTRVPLLTSTAKDSTSPMAARLPPPTIAKDMQAVPGGSQISMIHDDSNPPTAKTTTAPMVLSMTVSNVAPSMPIVSRKRPLDQISFVYPRFESKLDQPISSIRSSVLSATLSKPMIYYEFGKKSCSFRPSANPEALLVRSPAKQTVDDPKAAEVCSQQDNDKYRAKLGPESIEDILYPGKGKKNKIHGDDRPNQQPIESRHIEKSVLLEKATSMRHLSLNSETALSKADPTLAAHQPAGVDVVNETLELSFLKLEGHMVDIHDDCTKRSHPSTPSISERRPSLAKLIAPPPSPCCGSPCDPPAWGLDDFEKSLNIPALDSTAPSSDDYVIRNDPYCQSEPIDQDQMPVAPPLGELASESVICETKRVPKPRSESAPHDTEKEWSSSVDQMPSIDAAKHATRVHSTHMSLEALSSKHSNESQKKKSATKGDEMSSGLLSGVSVEDAIRDKMGCRPRANSTDGELNLPRRGLCDEGQVLERFTWQVDLIGRSRPKGFDNLGNTCFLNSTLQCLTYLPPFCQSLLAMPVPEEKNGQSKQNQGKRITLMLRSLFAQAHAGNNQERNALAPRSIVNALSSLGSCGKRKGYKFRLGRQEDAHEFLVHLLDAMHDGELLEAGINQHAVGWRDRLPIPRLDETTLIHRIFGGYFRSQVRCTSCGYNSNTYDPFLDLSLEVSRRSCATLAHALHEFTRKETLDSENRWKCSGCKKRVCATKQLTVFRPPLSLCVQLKRFSYSGRGGNMAGFVGPSFVTGFGGGHKISKPIDFPAKLNLPLSDGRSCGYSLTGIVIHIGGSASSGHYSAYVKRPALNGADKWYHMDDSFAEVVSERTVLQQKDAYLLFYCRKEVKLEFPSPPIKTSMSAEQAKEFSRARARARADSFLDRQDGHLSTAEGRVFNKRRSNNELEPAEKRSAKRSAKTDLALQMKGSEKKDRNGGDHSLPLASESKSAQKRIGCISLNESTASNNLSTQGIQNSCHDSSSDTMHAANAPRKEHVRDERHTINYEDDLPRTEGSCSWGNIKASNGSMKRAQMPKSPDCSSESAKLSLEEIQQRPSSNESESKEALLLEISTSSTTLSEVAMETGPSKGEVDSTRAETPVRMGSPLKMETHQTNVTDLQTLETPLNFYDVRRREAANETDSRLTTEPDQKNKSTTKTRIVLGRNEGGGKVSVMVGHRYKTKASAWNPRASGSKGPHCGLLGNMEVGKWDDDIDAASNAGEGKSMSTNQTVRHELIRQMDQADSSRRRKAYLDRWDETLDAGKKKKMRKNDSTLFFGFSERDNAFQRIQNERDKRRKRKGHPRKDLGKRKTF